MIPKPIKTITIKCNKCKKYVDTYYQEIVGKDGRSQLGVYCRRCDKWIKWMSKTSIDQAYFKIK